MHVQRACSPSPSNLTRPIRALRHHYIVNTAQLDEATERLVLLWTQRLTDPLGRGYAYFNLALCFHCGLSYTCGRNLSTRLLPTPEAHIGGGLKYKRVFDHHLRRQSPTLIYASHFEDRGLVIDITVATLRILGTEHGFPASGACYHPFLYRGKSICDARLLTWHNLRHYRERI